MATRCVLLSITLIPSRQMIRVALFPSFTYFCELMRSQDALIEASAHTSMSVIPFLTASRSIFPAPSSNVPTYCTRELHQTDNIAQRTLHVAWVSCHAESSCGCGEGAAAPSTAAKSMTRSPRSGADDSTRGDGELTRPVSPMRASDTIDTAFNIYTHRVRECSSKVSVFFISPSALISLLAHEDDTFLQHPHLQHAALWMP